MRILFFARSFFSNFYFNSCVLRTGSQTLFVLTMLGWSSLAWAQPVQWSPSAGGNGHYYELVSTGTSWPAAKTAAESMTVSGVSGHLATITSEGERIFIVNNLTSGNAWLGGFQGLGHTEPAGNWELVTGEPFVAFWNPGEPNNSPNDSDCLELRNGGFNDRACSQLVAYLVEYDTVPQPEQEATDLTEPSLSTGSRSGAAAAMSLNGTLLAVGAPSATSSPTRGGRVDIYRRVGSTVPSWQHEASLVAPIPEEGAGFGSALGFDPETQSCLAVGEPGRSCTHPDTQANIPECGAVYIYCNPTWSLAHTLSPPAFEVVPNPPASRGMNFGASLAWAKTNSSTLVVGAPGRDNSFGIDAGDAYEFTVNSPPVLTNTLSSLLNPGDLSAGSEFGKAVAVRSGNSYRIAVGAPGYLSGKGRVITFFSSSPLVREQIFDPTDGAPNDRFGAAVALSRNPHLAVGAPRHGATATGAVYLYQFNSPGTFLQKEIGPQADCEFGASVALSDDGRLLLVGGPGCSASPPKSGQVFQYFRFNPFTRVNAVSPPVAKENGRFGESLAVASTRFAVGEPAVAESQVSAGATTVYRLPDTDEDGVPDGLDICPGGDDTIDTDGDGGPDFCDICPLDPENDADGDGICESADNCPNVANPDQSDIDQDLAGDACDSDIDGDGFGNETDNCPFQANPDQSDIDQDQIGDVCDLDADGDGVSDGEDACLLTAPGGVVNAEGCSIAQLCPCENSWKNHGAYVKCVAHAAEDFVEAGLITDAEKDVVVSQAGQSSCGHKQ